MFPKILYAIAAMWLILSFFKDRQKTKSAIKKAWESFEKILPSILSVLLLIGLILAALDTETISKLLGTESGAWGMFVAAVIGCVTLIPGFVAFPLAASLLRAGAGYAQISIFISTLMMVGVATFPLEEKYFGRLTAFKRNSLSLAIAIITSCVIGVIMR
ncbi:MULTISPECIES: permease [Anaerotruncus]|uniref:permease n=1 Tax=Anaerotruncus TaxID=244127 RepID=UPI000B02D53C|nr:MULTISPECIES: permease [Anaerotruncus]